MSGGTERTALAERLHRAALHLLRRLRVEDEALGLTAPRASALSVLVFAGAQRMGDLARAEQVRVPTMSRLVQALEREGLARREADASDGRIVWVHATPAARRLLQRGRARRVRALRRALSVLDENELGVLDAGVALMEVVVASGAAAQRGGSGSSSRRRE